MTSSERLQGGSLAATLVGSVEQGRSMLTVRDQLSSVSIIAVLLVTKHQTSINNNIESHCPMVTSSASPRKPGHVVGLRPERVVLASGIQHTTGILQPQDTSNQSYYFEILHDSPLQVAKCICVRGPITVLYLNMSRRRLTKYPTTLKTRNSA